MEAKKRKVTSADWDKVERFVSDEYEARKTSKFRQNHETIWKEVDRQIRMEAQKKLSKDGKPLKTWHSAIELGELSKASEIITSDVMRIMFPQDKPFYACHVELTWPMGKNGLPEINDQKQDIADNLLKNLMGQQHRDFGFKANFRLSVKESLHHGSFVSEVRFRKEMMVRDGDKVRYLGAPIWVPYSMWNAYPDPSPSVIGTNLFYTGSMILCEYVPLWKLKQMANGEGWIKTRLKDVDKKRNKNGDNETEDVELIKFKGDISISRSDGDIYLPNSEVILANGKLVYYGTNELPYPNVVFSGYERQDVRDPYYTSPIIKLSPIHKITTITANKFLDASALKVEPPVEYDSNDPDYAANDGPEISPGAKTGTKSMGAGMKVLDIGDPRFALDAMQIGMRQLQEGLGVSSLRMGVQAADRQTATEANLMSQGSEVRTLEFISQLESQALLPFLYMQHELNRMHMEEYTFYNDEMHTPDFIRATKKDIQANAHFEIVGSRGLLGEEQRQKKLAQTVAFFSGNPLFAPKLKTTEIMLETFRDAGKKNPEEWVSVEQTQDPNLAQAQQIIQQLQQENAALKSKQQIDAAKIQSKEKIAAATLQNKREKAILDAQLSAAKDAKDSERERGNEAIENAIEIKRAMADIDLTQAQTVKTLTEAALAPAQALKEAAVNQDERPTSETA